MTASMEGLESTRRASTSTPDSNITVVDLPSGVGRAKNGDVEMEPVLKAEMVGEQVALPPQPEAVVEQIEDIRQSKRRWLLLAVFCVAMFLDVGIRSGLIVFIEAIAEDLRIPYETSTWIVNSYTITFGAVLPLWGRVADLFSAKTVFIMGFAGFGACQIIISVLPEQYSYFIFRGLSGCFAGATVPAGFRLITSVFAPQEIPKALAIFSLAAGCGNSFGFIFGGVVGIIPGTGQMEGWRWYLRICGIICVPFCLLAHRLCPKTQGSRSKESSKLHQIDLPGAFLIFSPLALLVLGLTFGASYGWTTPSFLVPFLLSWPLFVAFFVWEARLPPHDALVPPSFWRIRNVSVILFSAIPVFPWWVTIQIPLVERFERIYGDSKILSAVRLLPIGVSALVMAYLTPKVLPRLNIRATLTLSMLTASCMLVVLIYSHGEVTQHAAYWKYIFPALTVGSGAMMLAFAAINITIVQSVPAEMAGVAGGFTQVALQLGSALGLGIQQGLLSVHPGDVDNFTNVQISWWAQFGWQMVITVLLAVFVRDPRKVKADLEAPIVKTEGT